jgi:predicted nicotinamide N-methyase
MSENPPAAVSEQAMPETPLDALGPTIREKVIVEGQDFIITRPDKVDRLLDHPALKDAFGPDEYMPFWADLWPAARMLAKAILKEPWPAGENGQPLVALEIGCGLGLPGVVALSRGLRVIFSDYDKTALRFAADNAAINGFDNFDVLQVDWRKPPKNLQVPVVLGSDLIYEQRMAEPLAELIKRVLAPSGFCLMGAQDRPATPALLQALGPVGLQYTSQPARAGVPGGERYKGNIYRIMHCSSR